MKLKLTNFRCYENKTFEFDRYGMTLLSGGSGCGKSTSFVAINFALFGTGNNVTTSGKSSCVVEFEFNDIHIRRSKKPNNLKVKYKDIEYDSDAAQDIINRIFGETFDVTGYISQNAMNSFILMKPQEKMNFLEKFAFKDVNIEEMFERCKRAIYNRSDKLKRIVSRREMAEQTYKEMVKPDIVLFPIKCKKEERSRVKKNEEVKIKNSCILIKKSKRTLDQNREELQLQKVMNASNEANQSTLVLLRSQIGDLKEELDTCDYKGDENLDRMNKLLLNIINGRELSNLKKRYEDDARHLEEMKSGELESMRQELEEIGNVLWKEYSEEETTSLIGDKKNMMIDVRKLNRLEEELKIIDNTIVDTPVSTLKENVGSIKSQLEANADMKHKLSMECVRYRCPVCNCQVQLQDSKLVLGTNILEGTNFNIDDLKNEASDLKKQLKNAEKTLFQNEAMIQKKDELSESIRQIKLKYEELQDVNELTEDVEYLQEYKSEQSKTQKQKDSLLESIGNEKYSKSCSIFIKSLKDISKRITKLEEDTNSSEVIDIDEEQLRQEIDEQTNNKRRIATAKNKLNVLQNDINIYVSKIETDTKNYKDKYLEVRTVEDLEAVIKTEEDQLQNLEHKRENAENNIRLIEKFEAYEKQLNEYNNWEQKLDDLKAEEIILRNKYAAALLLKEKILEAESIAMINVIESINTHAQVYLESFFPEHPINVRLVAFKETKKNTPKPQINIEIDYKGLECDLNSLSGGELSRVILAYTLALADMFSSPMVLLDESTASLDQDLTTVVFDCIKENFKDKCVLIIAHQVTQGTFDHVINLC